MDGNGAKPVLWLVVPCYNEQEVLPATAPAFLDALEGLVRSGKASSQSRICFVDDGSTDATWDVIGSLSAQDPRFVGVALSRNQGHQNALYCGLMEARPHCDLAISLDCDGQDDVAVLDTMMDRFLDGDDVVYGVRSDRSSDSAGKRVSAGAFYRIMQRINVDTIPDHADFRLMSARAIDALAACGEVNLYLRGMVPLLGLPSSTVNYARKPRVAGSTRYPLRRMLSLALDGLTSFSTGPIRLVSVLGILFSLLGLVGIVWALVAALAGHTVSGWASTVVIVCLIGGVQLLSLGVIGEYVGKLYLEAKRRPRYIVKDRTWKRHERHYKG